MQKKELRSFFREKRKKIKPSDITRYSEMIGQRLVVWLDQKPDLQYIHTFLPAQQQREVDTFPVMEMLFHKNPHFKFVVPKIEAGGRNLGHYLLTENTKLSINQWGIPEPVESQPISPQRIDLVLVPLLAYDQKGNRVGYGGGFYDTFLQVCQPGTLKVGLSFFDPVEAIDDVETHDVRINLCVTPDRIWEF